MTDDGNSQGRFLRIEGKLDDLIDDVSNLKVDIVSRLTRLETASNLQVRQQAERVSNQSYKWMVRGIVASFAVGVLSLAARFV